MMAKIITRIAMLVVIISLLPLAISAQTINLWPGDVDNNGVVNSLDLIYLGRAFGIQGPLRTGTNNTVWSDQQVTQWNYTLPDTFSTNSAYADCNGNGVVDDSDADVVMQNYGLTDTGALNLDTFYSQGTDNDPALYFASLQDTFTAGSQASLFITIGTPSIPVDSFFGITFSIYYDTTIVKKNSVFAEFNSRLIDSDSAFFLQKNLPDSARIDVAVSLKGYTRYALSGYGDISTVSYILENNIIGKTESIITLPIVASHVRLVDRNLRVLRVNSVADTIYIVQDPTGIANAVNVVQDLNIHVFPNPAKGQLIIDAGNEFAHDISLFDVTGREVIHTSPEKTGSTKLNINSLASGIYSVKVTVNSGVVTKKVLIQN